MTLADYQLERLSGLLDPIYSENYDVDGALDRLEEVLGHYKALTMPNVLCCPCCSSSSVASALSGFVEVGGFQRGSHYDLETDLDGFRCLNCQKGFYLGDVMLPSEQPQDEELYETDL